MSIVGPSLHPVCEICLSRTTIAALDVPAGVDHPLSPTVVAVPGYTGSKEDFAQIADLVAAGGRRFVAIDQRGQHHSPGGEDPSAYDVESLAHDLLELRAALGGAPVHLVGHSFGGLVSRAAVLADPGAFASLTLLCSGPAAVVGGSAERVTLLRTLLATMTLAEIADLTEAADPVAAARPAEVRAFLRARFLATSPASFEGMGAAILVEPDRVEELRASGVPVLVTHGDGDDVWLPAVQREMAERLAASYAVVEGAMHSPAVEQPEGTVAVLEGFWRAVETMRPGPPT